MPIKSASLKHPKILHTDKIKLVQWYQKNKRVFPWREPNKNPYKIWIAEVMLQQTQAETVIPYYQKFLARFPSLATLAKARQTEVLAYWAGLGYYHRARYVHKAAKIIFQKKYFPKHYQELLLLPSFGPYTARSVSSLAFEQPVGVLDANVMRVLCRYLAWKIPWWENTYKKQLQAQADKWVKTLNQKPSFQPSIMNQALMELGALVCLAPAKPLCQKCPIKKNCTAFQIKATEQIPLKKIPKKPEIWLWKIKLFYKKNKIALTKEHSMPFLKGQLVFPGIATKQKNPPKNYQFVHFITHHRIYIQIQTSFDKSFMHSKHFIWLAINSLLMSSKISSNSFKEKLSLPSQLGQAPSSLIQKILKTYQQK